jgi:hypothetical protein
MLMDFHNGLFFQGALFSRYYHTPIILELGRWKHEDHEFEVSLDYIARPYFKKQTKKYYLLTHLTEQAKDCLPML